VIDAWALANELLAADLEAAQRELAGLRARTIDAPFVQGHGQVPSLDVRLVYVPPGQDPPLPFGTVLCGTEEPEPTA
jgi:hypothetical protein